MTKESIDELVRECSGGYETLEGERDALKARWFADDDPKETEYAEEFAAYRRDFPKEPR